METNQTNALEAEDSGTEEERELRPGGDGVAGRDGRQILHGDAHGEHNTEDSQGSGDDWERHQELEAAHHHRGDHRHQDQCHQDVLVQVIVKPLQNYL